MTLLLSEEFVGGSLNQDTYIVYPHNAQIPVKFQAISSLSLTKRIHDTGPADKTLEPY